MAKHHGPNHPAMPPYVAFMKHPTHVAWGGWLGKQYDPFVGDKASVLPQYDLLGKSLLTERQALTCSELPGQLDVGPTF